MASKKNKRTKEERALSDMSVVSANVGQMLENFMRLCLVSKIPYEDMLYELDTVYGVDSEDRHETARHDCCY